MLAAAGRTAFVDTVGVATQVAAGVALVGAGLIARYLPAHHREREREAMAGDGRLP